MTIEFLAAILMLLSIVVVSIILQSPLEGHANPDKTPNPSKAPWYFLNLQELLLHMHPSLAGVLIPAGVVFGAIPLIPYFDRNTADVGKWFGTPKAIPICIFTTVYSTIVLIALILFDEYVGVKPLMQNLATALHAPILADVNPFGIGALSLPNVIVPMILMNVPIVVLLALIKLIYQPRRRARLHVRAVHRVRRGVRRADHRWHVLPRPADDPDVALGPAPGPA